MRFLTILLLGCAALTFGAWFAPAASASSRGFVYVSPMPGSDKVSRWNNVAIRQGSPLDIASVDANRLTVVGSESGAHSGRFKLASDGSTIVFTPDLPYALGETVRVRLATGTRTSAGVALPELDYSFRVSPVDPRRMPRPDPERLPDPPEDAVWWQQSTAPTQETAGPCDLKLPGFPAAQVVNVTNPNPGAFFTAPFPLGPMTKADIQITDDRGRALFQRTYTPQSFALDFKMQPNGRLSFWMNGPFKFMVMDSAYAIVDSFTTGNGYYPDPHDFQMLPNGHVLMMSYDPQPVAMDTVVAGGDPAAMVSGLIIQELDENKDVVFQWRSWDAFRITDGSVSSLVNLQGKNIDYVHGNSVAWCPDGNLIISSRHMNEISKIDRQSGQVMWRLGRNAANNQFTFPNDTRGFSHQHDARILPNGHLTLFDNGNDLSPLNSRALEYDLDEENLVATKVWEYWHTPQIYGGFMGNVQRHADGSTTIGWGGNLGGPPSTTDLHADGTVAAEVVIPQGTVNYRGFRHEWRTNRFLTDQQELDIAAPGVGSSWGKLVQVWNNWDRPITIDCLRTADDVFSAALVEGTLPVTLQPGETTLVQVVYDPVSVGTVDSRLYVVQQSNVEMVAQSVILHGHVDGNVGVGSDDGMRLTTMASPNPLRGGTNIEFTLPSTGPVKLEIYDVGGRKVATLLDETRAPGRHVVRWSPEARRGGLYFYRLRVGGKTVVRKLVVAG